MRSLLIVIVLSACADAKEPSLARLLHETREANGYIAPTAKQRDFFRSLVSRSLTLTGKDSKFRNLWKGSGWKLHKLNAAGETVWLIERSDLNQGAGLFAIRPTSTSSVLLQAPHAFYDKHSRKIARLIFEQSNVRAVAWNSVHRKVADLAHSSGSYFNVFTEAFAETHGSETLAIQVHGFAKERRRSAEGATAEIVLSNGTRFPPLWDAADGRKPSCVFAADPCVSNIYQ